MIVFDLCCGEFGHVFEAWFGSSDDYEDQRRRGLLACPLCGTQAIEKAVMAPRIGGRQEQGTAPQESSGPPDPLAAKAMLAAMATMQADLLSKSEHVGSRFADEARAIHLGEATPRSIHGQATRAEAASLIEDGVPVAPLLLPVHAANESN